MSQPPQGEDPWAQGQGGRPPAPGWGQPSGGWGPPSGGWGPPSGGWGPPSAGPYGQPGPYEPPGQYAQPGPYGSPSRYGTPSQYGDPGQYGGAYGQPGPYGGHPGPASPYGYGEQPAWGQPGRAPAQPAHEPRRSLATLVFLAVIIAGVVVYVLTTGATRLDPDAVERDVAAQYEQREGVSLDLSCDQAMNVRSGRTYECAGTTGDGRDVTITIEVLSTDGDYTWSDR
ncbi:DUF4333 domain-containing protein [Modestobacter marinus]|uniref:DUF4333 domain-containing protein n=1 Tax=Modestobacter marinus TaxID=477641 RepID=UPI001C97C983|nr:DUF4333 domain-containing protein [Modestobacter marinus]